MAAEETETSLRLVNLSKHSDKMSLHQAARDNRHDVVERHLRLLLSKRNRGRVLNHKDEDGYAAIHYAAKFNRYRIMIQLVAAGADAELQTEEEKFTPLHLSARYQPRYYDYDIQQQESVEDVHVAADSEEVGKEEEDVSYLASSRKATKFLVEACNVDVNAKALYGITPLHLACQRGNKAAVTILLKSAQIIENITDDNKDTPLHEACQYGETEIVEKLLQKMKEGGFVDLCCKNDINQTPLHNACREGYSNIVKLLLSYGIEQQSELVNAQDNECSTPLHLVCQNGNQEIVHTLLLNGADMHQPKDKGLTPIHTAARFGFVKVVETLLKSGEDIINVVDIYQQTPIHSAARFNQPDMVDYLLDNGADIEVADVDSYTPLMTAAAYGQTQAFKRLLDRGAHTDVLDKEGKSIVFLAAKYNHVAILRTIVQDTKGAKLCGTPDASYDTPLHVAAEKGNLLAVRVLIRSSVRYVKLDAMNKLNKTPMHLATENGHILVVHELIHHRMDTVGDEDEDGNTPLHLACIKGYPGVARVLLDAKADIEARNSNLWTPVYCAANYGHENLVQMLIDFKAEIDSIDRIRTTPLHLASQEGHVNVVNILLQKNANILNLDQQGYNALDLAIENGHEDVAMAIIRSAQWKNALRNTTKDVALDVETTPLRKLIRKMPAVAKEVFDRCMELNTINGDNTHRDSNSSVVTFDYEFLEDYRDPKSEHSPLRRRRSRRYVVNKPEDPDDEEDSIDGGGGKMNFKTFLCSTHKTKSKKFSTNWGPIGFNKANHPLSIMAECERTELLVHPLITSLLHYKWNSHAFYWFYANFVFYIVFLFFLTLYALLLPNPLSNTCRSVFNGTFGNTSELVVVMNNTTPSLLTETELQQFCDNLRNSETDLDQNTLLFCGVCDGIKASPALLRFSSVMIILIALSRLGYNTIQLLRLRLSYLFDGVNWIDSALFTLSLIFAWTFHSNCQCPYGWQWQVGAAGVFLAWINLVIFARKLPLTGIYVLMLQDIFHSFLKMTALSFVLVITFALTFYMAFFEPGIEFSRSPFATPGRAIIKTITMSTGEFEYDGIFRQTPGGLSPGTTDIPPELPFLPISFLLWIIFIIVMPILLTNLLVGLAVDDIKGIQEAAQQRRLALKVEVIVNIEELLSSHVRRHFVIGSREVYSNRRYGLWEWFNYLVLGKKRAYYDSPSNVHSLRPRYSTPILQMQAQTTKLSQDVKRMKEAVNELGKKVQVLDVLENYVKLMALKQGITSEQVEERESDEEHSCSVT